jgi:hypothetical protein
VLPDAVQHQRLRCRIQHPPPPFPLDQASLLLLCSELTSSVFGVIYELTNQWSGVMSGKRGDPGGALNSPMRVHTGVAVP